MRNYSLILIIFFLSIHPCLSDETKYILHDRCINILYKPAVSYFKSSEIVVLRDSRGIILRFKLDTPEDEFKKLSDKTKLNILKVGYFLAKIKNPVIIEVHVTQLYSDTVNNYKKWEISAVIADNIVKTMCNADNALNHQIHAVGYGEFLPENNTPNNGGKLLNRVDIIVLCNIIGE